MALINHSCAPNAATMVLASSSEVKVAEYLQLENKQVPIPSSSFESRTKDGVKGASKGSASRDLMMVVRAATALKAGEEVTIAYTGMKQSFENLRSSFMMETLVHEMHFVLVVIYVYF